MLVLMDAEELLRTMYAGFNARDIDAVLAAMTADVDWPNAWEGGRLGGHDAVRDYWSRQWAAISPVRRWPPAASCASMSCATGS
jgi:nuclear transport factor 2 (NTF2) superfamily protein